MAELKAFNDGTLIKRHPDQLTAEIGGEVILMSITHGKYIGLDSIGSHVWRQLQEPRTVGELCQAMVRDYRGDSETIRLDLAYFLNKLDEESLIEITP